MAIAYVWRLSGGAIGAFLGYSLTRDLNVALMCSAYGGGPLELYVPIRLIRTRYGLPKEALGLRRGTLHPLASVLLGLGLAVLYHLLVWGGLFGFRITIGGQASILELVLAPLYLYGFALLVLTPLGEEVFTRGFFYGRLRNMIDYRLALLVQAGLFSLAHLSPWHTSNPGVVAVDKFLIGLILGLLYEKTDSLYPAIVFHAGLNYAAMFRGP